MQKIIILASAKNDRELPLIYKIIGALKLNHIFPNALLKRHNIIVDYFFSITCREDKLMLKQILRDTDPKFLGWAINRILNWKSNSISVPVIHIHGNKDRIIPISNVSPNYIVENAGHFMTITAAKEVEILIRKSL